MRLAIITDAWSPQVNGVVTTLTRTVEMLKTMGHEVLTVTPDLFRTIPCPTYPEIRLAILPGKNVSRILDEFAPDAIHICTEGPLGLAGRRHCVRRKLQFTTSLHTRFPEYVKMRLHTPLWMGYRFLRWFHGPAAQTMVATDHLRQELAGHGLKNMVLWSRGVDLNLFTPEARDDLKMETPIFTYMGRVAVEKNIEAFLDLELPGTKLVIGGGPDLDSLRKRYKNAKFVGMQKGQALAQHLASGDVFVFPSLTDTFGLVMIEAMACGLPVAAFPVRGPLDVITDERSGVMSSDLQQACIQALSLNKGDCRQHAAKFSWENCTQQFFQNLVGINQAVPVKIEARQSAMVSPAEMEKPIFATQG